MLSSYSTADLGRYKMLMPAKVKRSNARPRRAAKKGLEQPVGLIVRRGAVRRFDSLKRKTAKLPVLITWDRRETERRDGHEGRAKGIGDNEKARERERRRSERRQKPSFTWELADFVVCERPTSSGRTRVAPARKRNTKT